MKSDTDKAAKKYGDMTEAVDWVKQEIDALIVDDPELSPERAADIVRLSISVLKLRADADQRQAWQTQMNRLAEIGTHLVEAITELGDQAEEEDDED